MEALVQPSRPSRDDFPEAVPHAFHRAQKEVINPDLEPNAPSFKPSWTRWPFLLVYRICFALIAGVIGGFIGKGISDNPQVHQHANTSFYPPTNTSANDKPLARILPIPTTGCSPVDKRKYLHPTHSDFTGVHYTTLCATRWTDNHLAAISAAIPSDCIEACNSFNDFGPAKACLGASFVPQWWNQTAAMERKRAPFNYFLMDDNKTVFANDLGFEVVALCLDESCPGLVE